MESTIIVPILFNGPTGYDKDADLLRHSGVPYSDSVSLYSVYDDMMYYITLNLIQRFI